jgi:hypothetical protein
LLRLHAFERLTLPPSLFSAQKSIHDDIHLPSELLLTQFPIHFESREFPTILVPVNPGNFVSSMKCTLFALLVLRTAALSTRSGFSAPPEELHAPLIAGTTPTTPTSSAIKRTGLKRSLINLASQMVAWHGVLRYGGFPWVSLLIVN